MGIAIKDLFEWSEIQCSLSIYHLQQNHLEQMNKDQAGTIYDVKFFTEKFLKQFKFDLIPKAVFNTTTKLGDGLYLTYFYLENKKTGNVVYHAEPLNIKDQLVVLSDNQKLKFKVEQVGISEFITKFHSIFNLMGDKVTYTVFFEFQNTFKKTDGSGKAV